jgi:hypothetical protein
MLLTLPPWLIPQLVSLSEISSIPRMSTAGSVVIRALTPRRNTRVKGLNFGIAAKCVTVSSLPPPLECDKSLQSYNVSPQLNLFLTPYRTTSILGL